MFWEALYGLIDPSARLSRMIILAAAAGLALLIVVFKLTFSPSGEVQGARPAAQSQVGGVLTRAQARQSEFLGATGPRLVGAPPAQATASPRATAPRPAPTRPPAQPTPRPTTPSTPAATAVATPVATGAATTGTPVVGTPGTAGTPDATGTVPATPTRSPNAIEGTVAGVSATTVSINTAANPNGPPQTFEVAEDINVIRNGQPASLLDIEATDRIIIQRDAAGKVLGLIVFAATPTPGPSPAVSPQATGSPSPAPSVTGEPTLPAEETVSGTVTKKDATRLTVQQDDGEEEPVMLDQSPPPTITRNGQPAQVADIRVGDTVDVTLRPDASPSVITARSTEESEDGRSLLWLLFTLIFLAPFLLLLLPLVRRRRRPFVVTPRQAPAREGPARGEGPTLER